MSNRDETLQGVINQAVEAGLRDLYISIPAKVVKWDASNQRANCQILVKNITSAEDDEREVASWPVVTGVPVQFIGAGGFRLTCPISDGGQSAATTGLLIFSHRSMDKWLTGSGGEVDPEFDHDHALGDAVFLPGLMPFGGAWSDCPTDYMSIGSDGLTGLQLRIKKDVIIAASVEQNSQFVVLADKMNEELAKIIGALSNLVAPAGGGPVTGNTYTVQGDISSTKFKAE